MQLEFLDIQYFRHIVLPWASSVGFISMVPRGGVRENQIPVPSYPADCEDWVMLLEIDTMFQPLLLFTHIKETQK